jgi:molybdopterin-guanine dinucleotide biosynthesis protein A
MWSAAILAGGRARRFGGRDKSALVVDGRSIRERQVRELTTLTTDILIVGGPGVATAPDAPLGTGRVIADRVPGCGPLGGLHAAFCEAHGDAIIVIA